MTASTEDGIARKGLQVGSLGLVGSVIMGVAAVAPAITSTASFGPAAIAVGDKMPAIILLGSIPMVLVALGYRELNNAMPDTGTTFTWVSRAFGPRIGWVAGWVLMVSMALGFANAAAIGVDFLFMGAAQIFSAPWIADLKNNLAVNLLTCLAILSGCAWVAYRGMTTTQAVQRILVGVQLVVLILFIFVVFLTATDVAGLPRQPARLEWFLPFENISAAGAATGLSLAVYMFWGWEITLTLNEETKGTRSTPGLAAWLTVVSTVILYLVLAIACLVYAGVGNSGLGLTSPAVQNNIFLALAQPAFGPFAILFSIATLFSAIACVQSTIMCPPRTMLAMGVYGALPAVLGHVGRYRTPGAAILISTLGSWATYAAVSVASVNALGDTVTALGILVCFYLSLTALACVWYFRGEWFTSTRAFFLRFLFPLTGGLAMGTLFIKTIIDSADPTYGSGSRIGPIGLVCVIGVCLILLGVVLMAIMNWVRPDFFRSGSFRFRHDLHDQIAHAPQLGNPNDVATSPEMRL
jgi:amino acid transporter